MWGNKPEQKPAPAPEPVRPTPVERPTVNAPAPVAAQRSEASRFNQNLLVKGEISGREDLYLDGRMEGSIRLPESRVTIGPNGRIGAEIEANEIVVEGHVRGNLYARTRLELRASCTVRGDAVAPRIAIQEGARLNGRVEMAKPEEVRTARAAAASSAPRNAEPVPMVARDSSA